MSFAALILAAGKSTRMLSATPKVLHPVAGKPMLQYGIDAVRSLNADKIAVVLSEGMEGVRQRIAPIPTVIQHPPQGTGHAVQCAMDFLKDYTGPVLVLYGDTPFLEPSSLAKLLDQVRGGAAVAIMGFYPLDAAQYGRLSLDQKGGLEAIIEYADCTDAQKTIAFCNAGLMAMDGRHLPALMAELKNDNAKGEYYLTDLVAIARKKNLHCSAIEVDEQEVMGVNNRTQLSTAEKYMQQKLRQKMLDNGVTLIDPETVYFSADTEIGKDVVIEPNVFFGPNVKIHGGVHIRAFCHIEGAEIKTGAVVGPFARLRPGTVLSEDVRIGNFVEVKNTVMQKGAKANHLTYLGDAAVGADANIGAGTITCNYDGFEKYKTEIGAGAFIGSNSALVAPVVIGAGAMIGAGSVITDAVEADALALNRAPQSAKPGWAKRFRDAMIERKKKKTA